MSTPLNHPNHSLNHSLDTKEEDIRTYYQSLSPNKTTIIRINTQEVNKSIESTDSQKPVFHLNKTKTFIKSLNLENNTINGFTDNNNSSIVVYRLSSDKNKDLLKRSVPISQSSHSCEPNPHKKRYLVSQKSGKVYELIDKSQVNGLSVKREASEPDTDLICDDEYFKYLNLIGSKRLKTDSKSSLNDWSLRNISKVVSNPKCDNNGNIIVTEVCPKPVSSESETGSNDDVNGVSRRKLAKSQWRTEVKDNTNRLINDEIDKFKDERTRRREKEFKEWQTNAVNTISSFDLSSSMAQRLFRTLFCPLNQLEKYLKTINYEEYCDESYGEYCLNSTSGSYFVPRISRRDGNDWSSRKYHHKYCFNRFQRLEKWRQLETGLNWRSRLLKSRCKPLLVPLNRIKLCPICSKRVELEPRHQCYEFEPHLRPSTSDMPSMAHHKCDSSDEVIVIGDDFLEEDMISVNEFHDIQSSLEVIKPDVDEEDDDIIIVEEVFKTKELNVIVKPILTSLPKTNSSEDYLGNSSSDQNFSHKMNGIYCKSVAEECHTISLVRNNSKTDPNSSQQKGFDFASNLFK